MSKMVKSVKESRKVETQKPVTNFMGGISYELNPLDTLKMVSASSIFGEPQYYRDGTFADGTFRTHLLFKAFSVIDDKYEGLKTSDLMEKAIDDALSYDFEGTIRWAETLRKDYFMRLNPQIIMVRAAMHPERVKFNEAHPGLFSEINNKVMARADEPASQFTYYLFKNGSKNNIPNILKRNWKTKLESLSRYSLHKYKNTGVGMIDVVRVCHANSPDLDELMQTGSIEVKEDENTWEAMRSAGKTWEEIFNANRLNHMALLRNLRGIFTEVTDKALKDKILEKLKSGVEGGKQFPFRYYNAMQMIKKSDIHFKVAVLDALEECIDIACKNMPELKGKTMCLSDNSGSAWGTFNSEYGTVTVAEIDNLSSVITARNSEEGYVGKFGDDLKVFPISKKSGTLMQASSITNNRHNDVGGATENGIWIFFRNAIDKKEHWDNIFIYSDMQAGHGGLYGTQDGMKEYQSRGFGTNYGRYVDVAKLIDEYRRTVNPKVNVFSVQTAGYNNVVIPEYGYRTNIMYGWTGKELQFASEMINFWDAKENE